MNFYEKLMTQAVCDHCGEFHDPHKGILCMHCGQIYDDEIEMPTLPPATLRLFFAALRRTRDYDLALSSLEETLTLVETEILSAFWAWVKADLRNRGFAKDTFAARLKEWQNGLYGVI